jgi:hypothetical protein
MECISNSPQEGTFHKEPLKLLYAKNRRCFFCLNLWLVLWNKPSSTHRCFFCVRILAIKEKKRGHAKALKGKKKGQKTKTPSPNSPGPLMWGGNQPSIFQ